MGNLYLEEKTMAKVTTDTEMTTRIVISLGVREARILQAALDPPACKLAEITKMPVFSEDIGFSNEVIDGIWYGIDEELEAMGENPA
jgi:hypothetical protein